ncbi:MAG: metallophosphoesterase [Phycisphaeraceae bacterium]|nr:metallophosphoesterase [Phycisphaeraceae bacterium]
MHDLDLRSLDQVCRALEEGARACREAACRRGSIDVIEPPGMLIATGDLHDNPVHFAKVVDAAGMGERPRDPPAHLTLHELIHSDRLINGMDFSYRVLARVAALKAMHPEHVHVLLANHELSQIVGAGIVKNGVKVVEAFDAGVEYAFGGDAERVEEAIEAFIRAMPLALRCRTPRGDILCAHSLPGPAMMAGFDPSVLDRELTDDDYQPRRGSAHLMVWGRGYDHEQLEDLVERWGINQFILGHDHVENGVKLVEPCALVLNSDHERGVYLPIDLADPPTVQRALERVVPLGEGTS